MNARALVASSKQLLALIVSLTVAAVVVTGAATLQASPSAGAESTPAQCLSIGIGSNYQWYMQSASVTPDLSLIESKGIRQVREDLLWSVVQPNSPTEWSWRHYDDLFTMYSKLHIDVLPILGYGTTWASAPKSVLEIPATPTGQQAYASFAAAVVHRYGPAGTFWQDWAADQFKSVVTAVELWNEPWFAPNPPSVRDYVNIVVDAADAVHAVDKSVLTLANIDWRGTKDPANYGRLWGDAVLDYADQLRGRIDAWALHPYAWPSGSAGAAEMSINQVKWAMNELSTHSMRGNIWITEVGFSTGDQANDPTASPGLYKRFLDGLRSISGAYAPVRTYVFTAARPSANTKPGSWDYGYNLIDKSGAASPALDVVGHEVCPSAPAAPASVEKSAPAANAMPAASTTKRSTPPRPGAVHKTSKHKKSHKKSKPKKAKHKKASHRRRAPRS